MSYGMIIAVQLDHQTEFDRLWSWVKNHMANGTGEIRWSVLDLGLGVRRRWSAGRRGVLRDRPHLRLAPLGRLDRARQDRLLDRGQVGSRPGADQVLQLAIPPGQVRLRLEQRGPFVRPAGLLRGVGLLRHRERGVLAGSCDRGARNTCRRWWTAMACVPTKRASRPRTRRAANSDSTRCVVNLMMDWYLFGKDPWQRDTYAPKFGAYSSSRNNGGAAVGCNSTLGFGLPASSGKALRGQALVDRRPLPQLLGRGALHARHAPRQRQLPHLVELRHSRTRPRSERGHVNRRGKASAAPDVTLVVSPRPMPRT